MFGLGVPELIFIFLLALILFGPKRLPEVGKMLGKGMGEFRKASTDLQRALNAEVAVKDEVEKELKATADAMMGRSDPQEESLQSTEASTTKKVPESVARSPQRSSAPLESDQSSQSSGEEND